MTPASEVTGRLAKALSERYRVERELGVGGMATVFLAHDLKHERDVALKVLHPELAAVLGAERFLAEIKVTAKLQHPHILPLLDSGEADGLLFYVMPVVDGEALRAKLQRETQLPIDDAVRITKEVASALDYAHRHGVIHRDIKPENILLHDGRAVVTDFGIALAVTAAGGARLTQTGLSLGTPQYMAPEQAMGEKAVDARADVYALGCVLYEMLAGQAPFTGPTAQAIVAQVLTTDALPVTTHRKATPPQVASAVHGALQKLAADRFASIDEYAKALDGLGRTITAAASHGPIAASSRSAWYVAAALVLGMALGGLAFAKRGEVAAGETRFYQIALPDSAPFIAGTNRFDASLKSVAISRDGRSLAYVASTPSGQRLALVKLDRGTTTVLRGTEDGYLPTFSPDGRALAFVSQRQVKRINLDDGTTSVVGTINYAFSMLWARNGFLYLTGVANDFGTCSRAIPENGGESKRVPFEGCPFASIAFAGPDEGEVIQGFSDGRIALSSVNSAARKVIADADGELVRGTGPRLLGNNRLLLLRDSSVFVAPVDLGAARTTGPAVNVLTNVLREAWGGLAHADMADDGTLVWVSGGDGTRAAFVWVNDRGQIVDTAVVPASQVSSYALSGDGSRIAYSELDAPGKARVLVSDLRRRTTDVIPLAIRFDPGNWIRNGTALSGMMLTSGSRHQRWVTVALSGTTATVDSSEGVQDESRDGKKRCVSTDSSLMIVEEGRRTVIGQGSGGWCRFSPDGSRASFDTPDGLNVVRSSGDIASSRVLVAPSGADEARWSEDGRTLYYRNANAWYAVPAPAASDMRPMGEPRVVFTGRFLQAWASWDRSRDGRNLLLQGPAPLKHRTINVMTNFPALVEAKLKGAK
jgi:hypothetical protein